MNAIRVGWIRKAVLAVLSTVRTPDGACSTASDVSPAVKIARAIRDAENARAKAEREQAGESPESEDDKTHVQPAIPRVQVPE